MEQNLYIPGDLVMLATKVYKVEGFRDNFMCDDCYRLVSINDKGHVIAKAKDIVPLKLSSEILEKNGFEKGDGFHYSDPYSHSIYIERLSRIDFGVYYQHYLLRRIRSVHQLQHLLFGLGLDSNMIV